MSWTTRAVISGLLNEIALENGLGVAGNDSYSGGNMLLDLSVNANDARLKISLSSDGVLGSATMTVYHVRIAGLSVDGAPSTACPLLADSSIPSGFIPVRVKTDRTIGVYDGAGTLLASTATAVPITGVSTVDVDIFFDTLSASTVYVWVYVNATEEVAAFNSGESRTTYLNSLSAASVVGGVCGASSNFGCKLSVGQAFYRVTTTLTDAPYLSAVGKYVAVGGTNVPPTAESSFNWTNSTTASPNTYQDIDDTGANDGDTTSIWDSQTTDPKTAHDALYTYSAANPLPAATNPLFVQIKMWQKLLGAGKNAAKGEIKLSGTSALLAATDNTISTSYVPEGFRWDANPSGGAWAFADANATSLAFGAQSVVQASIDTGVRITRITGPEWVYANGNLPIGTALPLPLVFFKKHHPRTLAHDQPFMRAGHAAFVGLFAAAPPVVAHPTTQVIIF